MSDDTSKQPTLRPAGSIVMTGGIALILVGIASGTISTNFDGFVKGFFQGAAIMLLILGVYAVSRVMFRRSGDRPGETEDGWLPSRDGDQ